MAPEHFFSETHLKITPACDVWSWAIMENEMFSGIVPCGYYAYVRMNVQFKEIGEYPIHYRLTGLKYILNKCFYLDFSKRIPFERICLELDKLITFFNESPENVLCN